MRSFRFIATALMVALVDLVLSVPFGPMTSLPPPGSGRQIPQWPLRDDAGCTDGIGQPCTTFLPEGPEYLRLPPQVFVVRVSVFDRRIVVEDAYGSITWAQTVSRVRVVEVIRGPQSMRPGGSLLVRQYAGACRGTKFCNADEPLRRGEDCVLFLLPAYGQRGVFLMGDIPALRIDHGIVRVSPKPSIAPSLLAWMAQHRVPDNGRRSAADAAILPYVGKPVDRVLAQLRGLATAK